MRTQILRTIGAGVVVGVGSLLGPPVVQAQDAAPDDPAARAATLQQLLSTLKASPPSTAEGAAEARAVLEALTERISELDQQLRVLERKLEIEREQATEKAKTAPSVTVSGQQGYSLRSSDGNFQIRFRGYIQSDGRFVGDSDTTSGPSTFVMRRVRPVIEATAFKIFDFKLMPDFGGGTTVLQDAYADAKFATWFRVRAGKYKAPFGLSRLQSATEMTFIERGTPTLIAPNRDLGVMAFGDLYGERLTYQVGVFNGVVDGGSADLDDRSGKDVVARVFAHPFRKAQERRLETARCRLCGEQWKSARERDDSGPADVSHRRAADVLQVSLRLDAGRDDGRERRSLAGWSAGVLLLWPRGLAGGVLRQQPETAPRRGHRRQHRQGVAARGQLRPHWRERLISRRHATSQFRARDRRQWLGRVRADRPLRPFRSG